MIYIYLFLLVIMAWAWWHRNILMKGLFIIYIISVLSAILLIYLEPDAEFLIQTKYEPLFYLLFILLIIFNGFSNFRFDISHFNIRKSSIRKYANIISWIYIPVVLLLLFNAINVLRNVDLSTYRQEADFYSTGLFKGGLVLSLCIYLSELFFVPQFLFFYFLQFNDVNRGLKIRLFFASFSFAFMTLMFAGRDGMVFWVMNALIFFSLYKQSYSKETIKAIKKGGIFIFSLLLIPFLAISFARFFITGSSSFADTAAPFFEYIGQGPHIFCQSFYVNSADISGYEISSLSGQAVQNLQIYLGWTFGTFVKSLIWTFGKYWAVLVAITMSLIIRIVIDMHNKKGDIWSFFIIIMLYQIPYWGVFYYRYSINKMEIVYSLFAIVCLVMYSKTTKIKKIK